MFSNNKNTIWRSAEVLPQRQGTYSVQFQNGELGTALYGTFGWLPSRNGPVIAWAESAHPSDPSNLSWTKRPKEFDK
jgi:hypothetical protein